MLQIDLTTLRPQELRQLLDTTRQHGQAELTYEILQEMAARRERDEREGRRALFARRKRSEPRTIELNLGDPLEIEDEPPPEEDNWDPPPAPEPETEPERGPEPEPDEAIYLEREPSPQRAPNKARPNKAAREPRPAPERRQRRWGWAAVALLFGLVAGSVLGWSFDEIAHDLSPLPVTADKAPTPTVVAQALPPAEPTATTAADDPTAIQPAGAAPAPDSVPSIKNNASASPPEAAEATPDSTAAMAPAPAAAPIPAATRDTPPPSESAKADTARADIAKAPSGAAASASPRHCATEPSPADQAICRDPHLQRLQRDLRDAYATALAAHEDRALLREHQLAWADARNAVTDPDKLAQLYEERIRKLNAATADALRQK